MSGDKVLEYVGNACELKGVKFDFEWADICEFAYKRHLKVDWKNTIAVSELTEKFQKYFNKKESKDGKGTYVLYFPVNEETLNFDNINIEIIRNVGHKLKSFEKLNLIRLSIYSRQLSTVDHSDIVYSTIEEFNKTLIDKYTDETNFNQNLKESGGI